MRRTAIDDLFDALAAGDIAAACAACTPDACVWHGFDGVALDLDGAVAQWQALIAGTAERFVADARRQATDGGFVQQHLFVVRTASGEARAWPVCIVVRIEGGKIARLDEYIDRAGAFTPEGGELRTPGL